MKHFFTSGTGHKKISKCTGLHMVLEGDFIKKVEIPTPSHVSIYMSKCVCFSALGSVLTENLSRTKQPGSEWANWHHENIRCLSAPLSGSFLLFLRWVFSLKLKSNTYAEPDMTSIFAHHILNSNSFDIKDQFWEIIIMIMIIMMKMVIVIMIKITFICWAYTIF